MKGIYYSNWTIAEQSCITENKRFIKDNHHLTFTSYCAACPLDLLCSENGSCLERRARFDIPNRCNTLCPYDMLCVLTFLRPVSKVYPELR